MLSAERRPTATAAAAAADCLDLHVQKSTSRADIANAVLNVFFFYIVSIGPVGRSF